MIKVKDLRIGNLIRHVNENGSWDFTVLGIGQRTITVWTEQTGTWQFDEKDINGILINEEIMLKNGFKKDVLEDTEHYSIEIPESNLLTFTSDWSYSIRDIDHLVSNFYPTFESISYIHELQNLFITLKKVELNIHS